MKSFDIPVYYRSSFISHIKNIRKKNDPRKNDTSPTILDFGPVVFYLARHFGFCYGVENAIEISYKAIAENPGKKIYLLSQMIHNPEVNRDLQDQGIDFIMDTEGNQFIDWDKINKEDIVIIPAFGTTVEIEQKLEQIGVDVKKYNTTCPFVEKVWKVSSKLGKNQYTIVIHGKHNHEETKATFSHSIQHSKAVIIRDLNEAKILADFIKGIRPAEEFYDIFKGRYSENFDVAEDLEKIGVVNQTTMLATETQEIANYLKQVIIEKYGPENYKTHFADTRDTLCYATNDNQQATYGLLQQPADLAIVVGGYNSSNTSHIVELLETKFPTFFISKASKIENQSVIHHFDIHGKKEKTTRNFLPSKNKTGIILTSGASCPDRLVDEVLDKILSYFPNAKSKEEVIQQFELS
jgi:4-hydroxy-3-methylbut-2-enyl diphosphate reductase